MDVGEWLVEYRAKMDKAEALWLERLAQFDREGLWALDGQLSCVSWLVWRLRMSRATAFEKVRVAHELSRRPVVAEAFRAGDLSYSEARIITRIKWPDEEVDRALVEVATSSGRSIADLERLVRSYNLYADQDRPPGDERRAERGVKILRGEDGTGQVVATLDDLELEEFAAAFQAFLDLRYRTAACGRVSTGDSPTEPTAAESEAPSRNETRADALMDMVRTALLHADDGQAAPDDRYMVHLVSRDSGRTVSFLDGRPLDPADAAMIDCDASTVAHAVGDGGEHLRLGRKTRDWNTAQRRAISVRDGGRCRFPGCEFRHFDVHHMRPWEDGGLTEIDNGMCCCRRHHRLLHRGYRVEGRVDSELAFYRPDGSFLGTSLAAGWVMAGSGGGLPGAPR